MHCVRLLHGAQPDSSRSWQNTFALRFPLDGLFGFFRFFLGLLGRFVGRSLGLGRLRREPVGLVGRFGLGLRFLLCQALRLGLRGNQMSP